MTMYVCRAATALGVDVPYRRTDFAEEKVIPRVHALLALPPGSVRQETTNPHHAKVERIAEKLQDLSVEE